MTARALSDHPRIGASFEGFAIEPILAVFDTRDAYFRGTHGGAEPDLFVRHHGKRDGFEFKHADAPGSTRSMRVALEDLGLAHLWVVYPGGEGCDIDEAVSVVCRWRSASRWPRPCGSRGDRRPARPPRFARF